MSRLRIVTKRVHLGGAGRNRRRIFVRALVPRGDAFIIGVLLDALTQGQARMTTPPPIEYADASAAVRAVYDDIKASRNVPDVNNFWKYLAREPGTLKRTWESIKEIMAPGALDPLTKEMVYLAVSVTNGCAYCIASHTAAARKAGMTEAMFGELMAVTGMANETNRLANGYRVPVDPAFQT
jgi:AhpD family alkylhydroperoxidase